MPEGSVFRSSGRWFRGNLHMHTTESDGHKSVADAARWYREHGYDLIAVTDHRKTTDASAFSDDDFLVIRGMELDCYDPTRDVGYHIVALGIQPFWQDEASLRGPGQALIDAIHNAGGLAVLAHPYWLGQDVADLLATSGAFALEVYNATCARMCKERGEVHWDGLLHRGVPVWGVAADDTHHYAEDAGRGWVMVRAENLSTASIVEALKAGQFYATQGPAILDMGVQGDTVWVHCSPVAEVRFVADRGRGRTVLAPAGEEIMAARTKLPTGPYVRIECIDRRGRTAWSQPLFLKR